MKIDIFEALESNVRSYCRSYPVIFHKAKGSLLYSESGRRYIDFFAGAGALNYGHNNQNMKYKLLNYLHSDAIIQGPDFYTSAKYEFLKQFRQSILEPRHLDYKIQFCGPTGTDAVEAAFKLARKIKGRPGIFSFMGGYHGMTLGSLAATGDKMHRFGAGTSLCEITFMPYPFGFMESFDTIRYIEEILNDQCSGIEKPSALICETVQAEGGVVIAPVTWLQRLKALCEKQDILLICDDIQVGCGRTGPFLSFERAGIVPDIVTLSKSISGYGLPLSLLLIRHELDLWQPGEHTGTFRGNQLGLVGATAALDYWVTHKIQDEVKLKEAWIQSFMETEIKPISNSINIRGIGLIWGIDFADMADCDLVERVAWSCFEQGLLIERVGRGRKVIKLMPALNIEMDLLKQGCVILRDCILACYDERKETQAKMVEGST